MVRKRPIARKHPRAIPPETIDKVLELRTKYHLGPQRIVWYLERYHGIKIAFSSVYRILVRHGVSRFPTRVGCRALHTCRYAKEVPGHHVQVDVKVRSLKGPAGKTVRRFQYTAIDDATRIRALQVYPRHSQANAISFIDYVAGEVPVPGPHYQDRPGPRVPGAVSLARGRQGTSARVYQAALTGTQRQGGAVPPH